VIAKGGKGRESCSPPLSIRASTRQPHRDLSKKIQGKEKGRGRETEPTISSPWMGRSLGERVLDASINMNARSTYKPKSDETKVKGKGRSVMMWQRCYHQQQEDNEIFKRRQRMKKKKTGKLRGKGEKNAGSTGPLILD